MGKAKPIPVKNRRAVENRSGGLCEGCGLRPATDVHHRKYKSRGGTHDVENLLALCGGPGGLAGGNHSGCHGVAHSAEGHELGWSVNSWGDPSRVPVLYRGELRILTADGRAGAPPREEPTMTCPECGEARHIYYAGSFCAACGWHKPGQTLPHRAFAPDPDNCQWCRAPKGTP